MVRDLDRLDNLVRAYKRSANGQDDVIAERLAAALNATDENGAHAGPETENPFIEALMTALEDEFISAVAEAMLGFEHGEAPLVEAAQNRFDIGADIAGESGMVASWWAHRLARFLVGDLWAASFHERLPPGEPDTEHLDRWRELRDLFIASLYKRSRAEIDLWPSQIDAAARSLDLTDNMVISLPTSAGKTRIAELAILACLAAGKRVMFVTPLRALSAQSEVGLQRTFAPLGMSVSSLYGAIGSSRSDEDLLRTRDIIVATPEKLDFALRNDPGLLDDIGLIVLDEGHMIGLGEREVRYEVQIQRLLRREDAGQRRIVCLSAILPDDDRLEDFVGWLTDDGKTGLIEKPWRPTRLRYGEVAWRRGKGRLEIYVGEDSPWVANFIEARQAPSKRRKKPFPNDQRELCLATAWRLIEDGQTVLVYCPMKRSVEPYAREIVKLHKQGLLNSLITEDEVDLTVALSVGEEWFAKDHPLLECLKLGVAVHHGSLPTPYRREIERLLRAGKLKVTVSSPTLAQGLNLTATALVFHGLKRGRDVIEVSQFRNVVGRAGRAFIDVEGTVLLPMFKDHTKNRKTWKELIDDSGGKEMESGLFMLVRYLMARMIDKNGITTQEQLTEYVANQSAWDFQVTDGQDAERAQSEHQQWEDYLALLDTAILSLMGEAEFDEENIEAALDTLLHSSLWKRRMSRQTETVQTVLDIGLKARTSYLWQKTSAKQRRAYFLAGIGLRTGATLDTQAKELTELLIAANGAILTDDQDSAVAAIISFAELVFNIDPFKPKDVPANWRQLTDYWLRGSLLVGVGQEVDRAALDFIEEALIYRLPWAMEAVRVQASALQTMIADGTTVDDYETSLAVTALETGALAVPVALLIKSGFASRTGAFAAVDETNATFSDMAGLRNWLRSDDIANREQSDKWPTPASRPAWLDFRAGSTADASRVWRKTETTVNCTWQTPEEVTPGAPVRVAKENESWIVATPDFKHIGTANDHTALSPNSLLRATITDDKSGINLTAFGPVT